MKKFSTLALGTLLSVVFVTHEALARPTIGLVLSGGGARGGAHVGVIRVLEDLRVPVDYVAGTSMGAVVGGLYASGLDAAELEEIVKTADWSVLLADRPPRARRSYRRKSDDLGFLVDFDLGVDRTGLSLPSGLVQGQNLDLALRRYTLPVIDIDDFDALPIPFRAVATDISTGEMVVFDSGDLVTAMHASMAVPGIFKPERAGGRLLVDGGIARNLPTEVMRGMGADVIIAVDVGFPLLPESELDSAWAVTSQMLTVLINGRTEDQLRWLGEDAIHIKPELGTLGSQEFHRLAEAMRAGHRAALSATQALENLSIAEDAYARYRQALAAKRGGIPIVDEVRVKNRSGLSTQVIEKRLAPMMDRPLDVNELEVRIADIYALDTFETVSYDVLDEAGRTILEIRSTAKTWGPNYLRFGVNLEDDFQGGSNYNVGAQLTLTEINRLGGEFRTELQIGESPGLFVEVFQPLDPASHWFINPKLELSRANQGLFDDGVQLAELRTRQFTSALEGGRQLGNWGELRAGITRLRTDQSLRIGEPGLATNDNVLSVISTQFAWDTIDQVSIPRHGTLMALGWNSARESIGSDDEFDLASFFLLKPWTRGRSTLLTWWNLGATLRDRTAGARPFLLGGPFSLSGYGSGELRGKHYGIGRLLYYRRLGHQSLPGLDQAVYLGASFEAGNAWPDHDAIRFSNTLTAGSLFVIVDTLLGPLYLGYGLGENSRSSPFLYLGQTF